MEVWRYGGMEEIRCIGEMEVWRYIGEIRSFFLSHYLATQWSNLSISQRCIREIRASFFLVSILKTSHSWTQVATQPRTYVEHCEIPQSRSDAGNLEPGTTNYPPLPQFRITNYELRISNPELRIPHHCTQIYPKIPTSFQPSTDIHVYTREYLQGFFSHPQK